MLILARSAHDDWALTHHEGYRITINNITIITTIPIHLSPFTTGILITDH